MRETLRQDHVNFAKEYGEAILGGDGIVPAHSIARSIREGADAVTDGPFVTARHTVGDYYLIEAPDLDTAVKMAERCPHPFGGVEVRQVMVYG